MENKQFSRTLGMRMLLKSKWWVPGILKAPRAGPSYLEPLRPRLCREQRRFQFGSSRLGWLLLSLNWKMSWKGKPTEVGKKKKNVNRVVQGACLHDGRLCSNAPKAWTGFHCRWRNCWSGRVYVTMHTCNLLIISCWITLYISLLSLFIFLFQGHFIYFKCF